MLALECSANRGLWEFLDTDAAGGLVLLAHTAVALLVTVLVLAAAHLT